MPVAVITGSSSPIGQAIAQSFRVRGYELILHSRQHRDDDTVCADLSSAGGQESFCEQVRTRTKQIDVLVHNAGTYTQNTFRELDRVSWQAMMSLNAEAPLFISKALLPLLEISPTASVIHVTDCMANRIRKNYFAYGASKALLTHLTLALAAELAPAVRVNAVAPGVVDHSADALGEAKQRILEKIPMDRFATAEDIAKAVVFLACDAPYANGEILMIDGGRRLV